MLVSPAPFLRSPRPQKRLGLASAKARCLGAGEDYASLHNPDYDFFDDLIPIGSAIFERIAQDLLGTA